MTAHEATRRATRPDEVRPVLDTLRRYAVAFDAISEEDEGRPRYTAAAFVEWVRREVEAGTRERAT